MLRFESNGKELEDKLRVPSGSMTLEGFRDWLKKEHKLQPIEREKSYRRVCDLNPYIAEPHIYLSQEIFNSCS